MRVPHTSHCWRRVLVPQLGHSAPRGGAGEAAKSEEARPDGAQESGVGRLLAAREEGVRDEGRCDVGGGGVWRAPPWADGGDAG